MISLDSFTYPKKLLHVFLCSIAIYHKNLFGRNQKLNLSLERGQIDSIFRINYTDPWIEGDDKRTSRAIMIQVINVYFLIHLLCPITFIGFYF